MRLLVSFLLAAGVWLGTARAGESAAGDGASPAAPAVKLAVIISVDQLRADYLVRFRPYFGEGGIL